MRRIIFLPVFAVLILVINVNNAYAPFDVFFEVDVETSATDDGRINLPISPIGPSITIPLIGDPPLPAIPDTIIQRDEMPSPVPSPATIDIEIVALSLKSAAPIMIPGTGPDAGDWDIKIEVDTTTTPTPGSKFALKEHPNGGSYTAIVPVKAKFTFIRPLDGETREQTYDFQLQILEPQPWEHRPCPSSFFPLGQLDWLITGGTGGPSGFLLQTPNLPKNTCLVGGELFPIDTTALLLAGIQTNAVWIMSALAVIGSIAFGAIYITTKKN